jgi:hypothetical protein
MTQFELSVPERQLQMKKNSIKNQDNYELGEEYDLSRMTVLPKGRFDPKRRIGRNIVVLEPDIAQAFPSDEAVNEALRLLLKASRLSQSTPTT